jgi:uncharacterized protein (TIGR02300 family)
VVVNFSRPGQGFIELGGSPAQTVLWNSLNLRDAPADVVHVGGWDLHQPKGPTIWRRRLEYAQPMTMCSIGDSHRPARGLLAVARPEFGIKRLCGSCRAKFYDLRMDPIVCPKCAAVYTPPTEMVRPRFVPDRKPALVAKIGEPDVPAELDPVNEAEIGAGKVNALDDDAAMEEPEVDAKVDDTDFVVLEDRDEDEQIADIIGDGIENNEQV